MSDRNRQPHKPLNRGTYSALSPSSSTRNITTKFHNPNDRRLSNPNSGSSKVSSTKETTSRNWDDDDCSNISAVVGTCPLMCPVGERARRERLRDLAVFERLHGDPAKTSSNLAVKKFCRTINTKDTQASDVRPVPVLEDTLNYLLNLLHSSDYPFEVVHDFVFDRIRSIRQDLSMQSAVGDQVIHMYERMVKFYILSHHRLHGSCETPDVASVCHLNMEQLMKSLATLLNLYEARRASDFMFQNEPEFYSVYPLLHLASDNQGEPLSFWLSRIPSAVMKSKEMHFAQRTLRYYRLGNYKRFICTIEEEASYLQYCILEPYIDEVRILALSCISYGGYKMQPYPLGDLCILLKMKDSDVESLCIDCTLQVSNDGTGKGLVSTKHQSIKDKPSKRFQKCYPMNSKRIESLLFQDYKIIFEY